MAQKYVWICLLVLCFAACKQSKDLAPSNVSEDRTGDETEEVVSKVEDLPEPLAFDQTFEVRPDALLNAALSEKHLSENWVRLFDGQSPYGWFVVNNKADWKIEDNAIKVTRGEKSFLCTSFQLADFELKLDFRCDINTNSGVFLRTTPHPESVATDCLELNIAPPDNPFPTGSFVQRKKLETSELGDFDPSEWHTYHIKLEGSHIEVDLDGEKVMELDDFVSAATGHISLQHNVGRVEFRNILLRPIGSTQLQLNDDWETDWELSTKDDAMVDVEVAKEGLFVSGGLGQLQSKEDFQDFFLHGSYTLKKPEVNSGIFFRCIRDNMLDGYECQVNHAIVGDDPLRPADAGAGAIFRGTDARIVIGDGTEKTHISLLAQGPQFLTWVNGVQVAEFFDDRKPDENPRSGLRLDAGPISIQAHDPKTEVTFHRLEVTSLNAD